MVAAVWQTSADFLKHYVHIRGCPFFDFGHLIPRSIIDATQSAKISFVVGPFPREGCRRIALLTRRRIDNARQTARLLELGVEHFHRKRLGFRPSHLKNSSLTPFFSPRLRLLHLAIRPLPLQHNHGLNIECHAGRSVAN
jgi:hypothetical protein